MSRKNFNYRVATVSDIIEHFKQSRAQAIYAVRQAWKSDAEMSRKIEEAYRQYKIDVLVARLSVRQ